MTTNYFDGIKVGEMVWHSALAWGEVDGFSNNKIRAIFNCPAGNPKTEYFDYLGGNPFFNNQVVFWDEIKFTPPPRPKRMVEKRVECFANVYPPKTHIQLDVEINGYNFSLFKTKVEAENNSTGENVATAKVEISWEEEQ